MRETQKLREKRKKNYGCVYLNSRRTAVSGALLLHKEQQHQSLMGSSMTHAQSLIIFDFPIEPTKWQKKTKPKKLRIGKTPKPDDNKTILIKLTLDHELFLK